MQTYNNFGGNSGIEGYELGSQSITVYFTRGGIYEYNYSSPGRADTEEMKRLAVAGQGLNTYISKFVKGNFANKIR